jgi:hypothetical protein
VSETPPTRSAGRAVGVDGSVVVAGGCAGFRDGGWGENRARPPWQGEGRAFEIAKRAEVARAADSPCTGPCTDWRPLVAGVGTPSVGSDDAGELIRRANFVELVRPRELALEGQRCAGGGRAGLSANS